MRDRLRGMPPHSSATQKFKIFILAREKVFSLKKSKKRYREKSTGKMENKTEKKTYSLREHFFRPLSFCLSPSDVQDRLTSTPPHWSATQKFEIFTLACKKAFSLKKSKKRYREKKILGFCSKNGQKK